MWQTQPGRRASARQPGILIRSEPMRKRNTIPEEYGHVGFFRFANGRNLELDAR